METTPFFLTWGLPLPPDSFKTGSHGSTRAGLLPRWCCSPYLALKIAHRRSQGRVWFSPSFLEMLLLRQRRQVTLQLVIYCLVDGKVRCRSAPHRISCAPWWVPYQSSTYPLAAECILLRCLRSCRYAGKSTQCWASTCGFSYPHRKSSRHREIVHLGLAPA